MVMRDRDLKKNYISMCLRSLVKHLRSPKKLWRFYHCTSKQLGKVTFKSNALQYYVTP